MEKASYGSLLGAVPFSPKAESAIMAEVPEEPQHSTITFADLGIPTTEQIQDTVIGKARPLSDIPWIERLYAALMLLSIIAAAILTIRRLTVVTPESEDFTFGLVLLFNAAFCIWFVIEGILRERPSEVFILTVATFVIMVYLIANYAAGTKEDVKLARLVVACIFCPVLVVWGVHIAWKYHTSKRLIFRVVGASEAMQKLYRNLLVFQDFLKFDLQLGGSMVIFIIAVPAKINTRDIIILSVGGVVTFTWFILGFRAMLKEWKIGAIIFAIFSFVEPAYVIYKIYDAAELLDDNSGVSSASIACGVGAVVVRFIVILLGILVFKNFGKGLKDRLQSKSS